MNTQTSPLFAFAFAWLAAGTNLLNAQVPQLVHYQGLVAVNGVNFDGAGQFKFALVGTNAGGGAVTFWSNNGGSSAGSEPGAAVGLTVAKGLYSVLLGDTALTNMVPVPATVFTNADVRLRVWFNDGTNGFEQLAPDQRVGAVGYAFVAANVADGTITAGKLADGAVTGTKLSANAILATNLASGQVVRSLNALKDDVVLAAGANVALATNGNTLLISAAGGSNGWSLTGNSNTSAGANFLGTIDNQPLELKVNSSRALRLEPGGGVPNLIGGYPSNFVGAGILGATISGGGSYGVTNSVNASFAAIGGGYGNSIKAGASQAVIAGGGENTVQTNAQFAVIGGGANNTILTNAPFAVVPGGRANVAGGSYSLAAGRRANATHPGAFVWADSTDADFGSAATNEFAIRAGGGVRIVAPSVQVVGGTLTGNGSGLTNVSVANVTFAPPGSGPPFSVGGNSNRVANLNADLLDGLSSTAFWQLGGNSGAGAANSLGTTDDSALELKVNNGRALRLEPTFEAVGSPPLALVYSSTPNVLGGYSGNYASNGVVGATISGGGWAPSGFSFSGPEPNIVGGSFATICGGSSNSAGGAYATVAGGYYNVANGKYSFAAGLNAHAVHQGAFVWADSQVGPFVSTGNNQFLVRAAGGIGLNFNSPYATLTVGGDAVIDANSLNTGSIGPGLTFGAFSGEGIASKRNAGGNQYGLDFYTGFNPRLSIANNGNVGIGTTAPAGKLDIDTGNGHVQVINDLVPGINVTGGSLPGILRMRNAIEVWPSQDGTRAGNLDVRDTSGNANITLSGNGTATVKVLQITGGADVAEPFPLAGENVPKGAVVVIDDEHPGQLKLSDQAYDTRVAGVVSGANGIQPGLSLRQRDKLDRGENVALSGRVYVLADAAANPIRPGDLLTTSATPGHAMKVTDHGKAQGAVLGKAMSGLQTGRGLVLVLVSLQ